MSGSLSGHIISNYLIPFPMQLNKVFLQSPHWKTELWKPGHICVHSKNQIKKIISSVKIVHLRWLKLQKSLLLEVLTLKIDVSRFRVFLHLETDVSGSRFILVTDLFVSERGIMTILNNFKWFLKLYNLGYSDETFIHCIQRFLKSGNSTYLSGVVEHTYPHGSWMICATVWPTDHRLTDSVVYLPDDFLA